MAGSRDIDESLDTHRYTFSACHPNNRETTAPLQSDAAAGRLPCRCETRASPGLPRLSLSLAGAALPGGVVCQVLYPLG